MLAQLGAQFAFFLLVHGKTALCAVLPLSILQSLAATALAEWILAAAC
jgi:hypothetical protein